MATKKKRKKRRNIKNLNTVIAVVLCIGVLVFLAVVMKSFSVDKAPKYKKTSSTQASTTSPTESATVTLTDIVESITQTPIPNADTTKPTITTGSFYDGVSYPPTRAKTTDVYKHGRNLMLVNNYFKLPEDFKWDLVYWSNGNSVDAMMLNSSQHDSTKAVDREAYEPLKKMFADAEAAGVPLQLVSAYRSIDLQDRLFTRSVNSYINQGYSKDEAIKKANVARTFTGTSEHNTGLGFDILEKGNFTLSTGFENTAQFKWLMENAENYGFILRYQKDKTAQTEIMYEPWHFRYVGVEHAKKINELGFCLEEYIAYLDAQ